jgi:hypothetical protein
MSSQGADVRSIDAIDRFRVSVVEFIDAGRVSITEADSDLDRNIIWLEREQVPYWTRQIRKRQEMVTRAKSPERTTEERASSTKKWHSNAPFVGSMRPNRNSR